MGVYRVGMGRRVPGEYVPWPDCILAWLYPGCTALAEPDRTSLAVPGLPDGLLLLGHAWLLDTKVSLALDTKASLALDTKAGLAMGTREASGIETKLKSLVTTRSQPMSI